MHCNRLLLPALAMVATASCGGGSSPGTMPTPVVAAPSIATSVSHVFIGQSVTFNATGSGVRWGSDAPAIATVDSSSGLVSGLASGEATIWAENAGGTTHRFRVLPNFGGTWTGSYVITGCEATEQLQSQARFCDQFRPGQSVTMAATFAQTADVVNNVSIRLGDVDSTLGPVGWGVANEGYIYFIGPTQATRNGARIIINISDGRLESVQAGVITGRFDMFWIVGGYTGSAQLRADGLRLERTGP